jgi:hypothetical protein
MHFNYITCDDDLKYMSAYADEMRSSVNAMPLMQA